MVLTCLVIAVEIRPQDNGVLDIVTSFHNKLIPVSCHNLLLTLHSFMVSWKGKYCMIMCIISVGRSIRLVRPCPIGFVDVVGVWLSSIVICIWWLISWVGDGLVLGSCGSSCSSCERFLTSSFTIVFSSLLTWFLEGMRPMLGCISLLMPFTSSLILVVHVAHGWLGTPQ